MANTELHLLSWVSIYWQQNKTTSCSEQPNYSSNRWLSRFPWDEAFLFPGGQTSLRVTWGPLCLCRGAEGHVSRSSWIQYRTQSPRKAADCDTTIGAASMTKSCLPSNSVSSCWYKTSGYIHRVKWTEIVSLLLYLWKYKPFYRKKNLKKIKILSQYCHWLLQVFLHAGWLSGFNFDLQQHINNFKNKRFLLYFYLLSFTRQTKPQVFEDSR